MVDLVGLEMGLSVYSGTSRLPLLLCYYEKTTVNKIAKTAEKETLFILSGLSAAILAHLLYQVLPKLSYCEYCITNHIVSSFKNDPCCLL